jgi:DNA-binding HxlR family transcriptional regulator
MRTYDDAVKRKLRRKRRSACPLNAAVEALGDRWSLLIVRDMMFGAHNFADLAKTHEGIATNVLAARLRRLASEDIVAVAPDPQDRRKRIYRLTAKGIALAPVMAEMVLWAAAHEETGRKELIQALKTDKEGVLAGIRGKWEKNC